MAESKIDVNFKNDLSDQFDQNKDTDTNKKEQNIYFSQIEEDEDIEPKVDDEEARQDETTPPVASDENSAITGISNRTIILVAAGTIAVTILIVFGVFYYFKFANKEDPFRAKQIAKVQQKCKEYTDLACSLQHSDKKNSSRIVDGKYVPQGMLPHQVFVRFSSETQQAQVCGGSLINEKFILTAAHCVKNVSLDKGLVGIGLVDIKPSIPNQKNWKKVYKVHVHPDYTGEKFKSDVSLLELSENLKFSSDMRPICLNTKSEKYYNSMIIAGWGKTKDEPFSQHLKMAQLHIDDKVIELCRKDLKDEYDRVQKIGICAISTQGGDTGDSGGPLVVQLKSNCMYTWEQIGIFSGVGGGYVPEKGGTQLFTRVEHFIAWIASVAWPD